VLGREGELGCQDGVAIVEAIIHCMN
jgi:hypothetical protein